MNKNKLKILIVSAEVAPYAKTGGLGEVIDILHKELRNQGVDARVVFPKYKGMSRFNTLEQIGNVSVDIAGKKLFGNIFSVDDPSNCIYSIGNDDLFLRDGFYGYMDDHYRFYFFTLAVFAMLKEINFKPDIINFNDWQTGLGSFYLKEAMSDDPFFLDIATTFSIHNIQHQGDFAADAMYHLGIDSYYFNPNMLEFYGRLNFMKAGIVFSDAITTVSKTYAKEIQTSRYSYGLNGVIKNRASDLHGIINGINYDDVSNGPIQKNRTYLQQKIGLPIEDKPIIGLVTRLVEQKGIDIIAQSLDQILSRNIQVAVLGVGEERYEKLFYDYAQKYQNLVSHIYFDTEISLDIYKHSDLFLMPSLFEPCGIAQMISMKYGTVPIVRKTGGLDDTVKHFDKETKQGNGFVFNDYDSGGLIWAIDQALFTYYNNDDWSYVVKNAISSKFSASDTAKQYLDMYQSVIDKNKLNI